MSELINVNEAKSSQEINIEEILNACSRRIQNADGKEDALEGIKILRKYFNPKNPLLDINKPLPEQGNWTALAFATFFGKTEEVKELIKLGANPETDIGKKINVLHLAATEGRPTLCVYFLNKQPAMINNQCIEGQTALMKACEAGHFDVVTSLMPYKPNIMMTDNINKTCLDYGMASSSYNIVRYIEHYYYQHKIPLKGDSPQKKVVKI